MDILNDEAKKREAMLDDAIKNMENISMRKVSNENSLQQFKIDEIKYKTTIDELNEYIEIYKNKLETLENEHKSVDKEVLELRKKTLKQETDLSTLKSIMQLLIQEYGVDTIAKVTKIDKHKIESYIED